jgi:transcription-repair coupling factor (superfamily II helicase)
MASSPAASAASERILRLPQRIAAQQGFPEVVAALAKGQDATFDGVWGSSCALLAAELVKSVAGLVVVIYPQQDDIDEFCDDLTLFSEVVPERFPAWESAPGERILHDEIYGDRLRTLKQLAGGLRVQGSRFRVQGSGVSGVW